jgi:hypothetical protein
MLSDINVVWCYVLSQYLYKMYILYNFENSVMWLWPLRNTDRRVFFYRLLVSSISLLKCSKLIFSVLWCQITVIGVPGLGQFRLVVSRYVAVLGKSSSRIWPFSVRQLPKLLGWEYNVIKTKIIFQGRTFLASRKPELKGIFKLTLNGQGHPSNP